MHAGNIHAVDIKAHYKLTGRQYDIGMDANTVGMLGRLAPWRGDLETTGRHEGQRFIPHKHIFSSWWRDEEERTTFTYTQKGVFNLLEITETGKPAERKKPEAELTNNTVDMLTGLAVMLQHFEKQGNCSIDVPSFDGKRSFLMRFKDLGDGQLRPHPLSAFSGTARACSIEIVPQKGHWREKPRGWMSVQEQSRAGGKAPTFWIASPYKGAPVIPVRFDVLTRFGPIIMRLQTLDKPAKAPVTPRNRQ